MNRLKAFFLIAVIFTAAATGCAKEDPVEVLLNKVVESYGGSENVEKLNSYAQVWSVDAIARGEKGTDARFVMLPDRLRVELIYKDAAEVRVLNGDKGLRATERRPAHPAEGPPLMGMKLQRTRLYTPLMLLENRDSLTLTEEEGFKVIVLKEGDISASYYVNPETMRIEKFIGNLTVGGSTVGFRTDYGDFGKVEDVLVPRSETKYAMGRKTAELKLMQMSFAPNFEDDVFVVDIEGLKRQQNEQKGE